jgi:hypothetical protein
VEFKDATSAACQSTYSTNHDGKFVLLTLCISVNILEDVLVVVGIENDGSWLIPSVVWLSGLNNI